MAGVSATLALPGQPPAGDGAVFTPFGGNGRLAPIGMWDIGMQVVGDATGALAQCQVQFDPRYTGLVAWVSAWVAADTAAGEFSIQITDAQLSLPNLRIVGTLPGVAEAFQTRNSSYLWYPPPIWLNGEGRLNTFFVNVDATETYGLSCAIYQFDRNVRQYSPAQALNAVRIGVNAPTAS